MGEKLVSIVIPVYNEQEVLPVLWSRLGQMFESAEGWVFETIFVDDGSTDASLALMKNFESASPVSIVSLSRNFGHQAALIAGLEASRGDVVAVIDADLQDPPELIIEMLRKIEEGFDVVYGTRNSRDGISFPLRLAYKGFYRLLARLSDVKIPLDTGDFRIMSRRIVDHILALPERDVFVRGIVPFLGFRQVSFGYSRPGRAYGKSKYNMARLAGLATSGLLSFSSKPLRIAAWAGVTLFFLAMVGVLFVVGYRMFGDVWVPGWAGTLVVILALGGMQLMFLGLIGEYIGRIFDEVKNRPRYIVDYRASRSAANQKRGRQP